MKKAFVLSLIFVVVFCIAAQGLAEENTKADFGFSLSGGKQQNSKETNLMGDFYLAQNWRIGQSPIGVFVQASGMFYTSNTKRPWQNAEYGASAGTGFEFYPWKHGRFGAYIFVDALGKNRFYFAQYRPTLMFASPRIKLLAGIAKRLTDPVVIGGWVSDPIFWHDDESQYYDIRVNHQLAETINYKFIRAEIIFPSFAKWFGEYIQGLSEYKDIYRYQLGVELKVFCWLSAELQWYKTQAENIFLSKWFDQNGLRYALNINPFAAADAFTDFIQRKFVEVFWPVVVLREENRVYTTKIADRLKIELNLKKKEFCIGEQFEVSGTIRGGTKPYHVYVDLGDGSKINFTTSEESFTIYQKYFKESGANCYTLGIRLVDAYGFEITVCECVKVKDCTKPCVPAKAILKADKYAIKAGESVTLTGEATENTGYLILNGGEFQNKAEPNPFTETVKPTQTTKYFLGASNECPSKDEVSITILVDECKKIVLKDSDLQVSPSSVKTNEKVSVDVHMAENATKLTLLKDGNVVSTSPGHFEFTFSEPGTHEFKVRYENDCDSVESSKIVTVSPSCVFCDENKGVTFHPDSSFALTKNNYPEGEDIIINFSVYNKSDCPWGDPIKYDIRYQDGNEPIKSGANNIGTIPPKTRWDMKFIYDWSVKTVTFTFLNSSPLSEIQPPVVQCDRKVQVKLSLGSCGPL